MLQKPITCQGCALQNISKGFSRPEGTANNGVLIIGEALGQNELFDGLPFRPQAEAGSVLQAVFRRLSLNRNDFAFWNLIACQPPSNKLEGMPYEFPAIEHCHVHFNQVLSKFLGKIKVIVALGNLPVRHLCPEILDLWRKALDTKDKRLAKAIQISSLRGYKLNSVLGIPVIPSLHPSYINMNGRIHFGTLLRDIYTALQLAKGNWPDFTFNYNLEPTFEEANKFYEECKANPQLPISYDIETPFTKLEVDETDLEYENIDVRDIDSIQFSLREGEAIFFPWFGEYIDIIKRIMSLPNPKIGWNNWKFDQTNIEYHLGKGAISGENHDLMWMWKHANPDFVRMGRSLQFVTNFYSPSFPAWKHLAGDDPKLYGCYDVDAPQRIHNGLTKDLKSKRLTPTSKSLYEGYIDDIVKLHPILIDLESRGLPIDLKAREEMRLMLVDEIKKAMDELQQTYPFELRNVTPEQGYKYVPKEIEELTEKFNLLRNSRNGNRYVIFGDEDTYNYYLYQYIERNSRIKNEEKGKDNSGLILKEFNIAGDIVKRFCRVEKFKPGSKDQVINYIKFMAKKTNNKDYKVPKIRNYKEGEKDTTTKDEIHQLWEKTGDVFFEKIVYVRELKKMKSTYVDSKKKGWVLGKDNRVHAEFKPIPATGQLSSKIHNAPARGTRFSSTGYRELANQFRKTIAAGNGKILLSGDWSSFHALTLAEESQDPQYMRLVRIDVHSFIAAYILNNELPTRYAKLRNKKPDKFTTEQWTTKVSLYEEALNRFKNLKDWLQLSDEDLKIELKWIKKNFEFTRNSQAKPAILGMGFGMKENKFFKLNRFSFKDVKECEFILNTVRRLFPRTFVDFHKSILNLADQQTYLISKYGYIRRFYDVFDWRLITKEPRTIKIGEKLVRDARGNSWHVKLGQDSNSAIAFLPANHAFGKKKEAMRDLWEYEKDGIIRNCLQEFGLVNEIHDDLLFEVEESKLEEAAKILNEVMRKPARHLISPLNPQGLITGVELKVGKNWGEMIEVKL